MTSTAPGFPVAPGTSSTATATALLSKPTSSSDVSRGRRPHVKERPARVVPPEAEIAGETTRVPVEQAGAIDARALGELTGHLTHEEMWGVDEVLLAVLGLR